MKTKLLCLVACVLGILLIQGMSLGQAKPISAKFETSEVSSNLDLVYGSKKNAVGKEVDLRLDLFLPPSIDKAELRPLIILIHGGGFYSGNKEKFHGWAKDYARHGFVAASLGYRLTPRNIRNKKPENFVTAATQATEDLMDAVRYLKTNSKIHGIDPKRIATVGMSAGGWMAGFNATDADQFNDAKNAYPGTSSKVQAAIITGVSYADGPIQKKMRDTMMTFDEDDTPILLFHAEGVDSVTNAPWSEAQFQQKKIVEGGNECELHKQPGNLHVDNMSPSGPYWSQISPFLKRHLKLN